MNRFLLNIASLTAWIVVLSNKKPKKASLPIAIAWIIISIESIAWLRDATKDIQTSKKLKRLVFKKFVNPFH